MITKFIKISTQDNKIDRIQDNVGKALDPISSIPFLDGILLKGISLKTGQTNEVAHGLGRAFQGYWPTRVISGAYNDILELAGEANNSPDKYILLHCSGDLTVDLWVF